MTKKDSTKESPNNVEACEVGFYFRQNKSFFWLLHGHPVSVVRFSLILLCWYIAAFFCCSWEGALRIPNATAGLFQDWFMWAILPVLVVGVLMTIRLLRRVHVFIYKFPEMLKPRV